MCVYIHAYLFTLYASICTNISKFKYIICLIDNI